MQRGSEFFFVFRDGDSGLFDDKVFRIYPIFFSLSSLFMQGGKGDRGVAPTDVFDFVFVVGAVRDLLCTESSVLDRVHERQTSKAS